MSASPTFFGGNPHEVREGDRKGLRTLEREEDLARKLVRSLNENQQKQAIVADVAYEDILTVAETRAQLEGEPEGLPASEMTEEQLDVLMDLIAEYAHNMPPEIAAVRMKAALETPREKLYFAWAGSTEPGVGDYYRVHSPTFLIEYDNTQNENNHSHSVWRDFEGDFGFDVLAWHHRRHDHGLPGKKNPGPAVPGRLVPYARRSENLVLVSGGGCRGGRGFVRAGRRHIDIKGAALRLARGRGPRDASLGVEYGSRDGIIPPASEVIAPHSTAPPLGGENAAQIQSSLGYTL